MTGGKIKSVLLFLLRWLNGLLCLMFLALCVGMQIKGDTKNLLPGHVFRVTTESLFAVALLAAFLGAKNLGNEARRNLGKWANVLILAFGAYTLWFARNLNVATDFLLFVVAFVILALINALVFWRPVANEQQVAATLQRDESRRFFINHWRGNLPLGISFWLNGWLVIASVLAFQKIFESGVTRNPKTAAVFQMSLFCVTAVVSVWLGVGIWRAATQQIEERRWPVWGALAKICVAIFFLNQIAPMVWIYFPKVREYRNDIAGHDVVEPYQIQVVGNGLVIEFRGGLRFGSAKAFQDVLSEYPNAKVLKIESKGGRVGEGLRMAGIVRERGISTYAMQQCASAATLVLMAGKERGAAAGAQIGFHASKNSVGSSQISDAYMTGSMLAAGISEDFVKRVLSVPNDRLWCPTAEEMLRARVLTSYGVFPPQSSTNGIAVAAPRTNVVQNLQIADRRDSGSLTNK